MLRPNLPFLVACGKSHLRAVCWSKFCPNLPFSNNERKNTTPIPFWQRLILGPPRRASRSQPRRHAAPATPRRGPAYCMSASPHQAAPRRGPTSHAGRAPLPAPRRTGSPPRTRLPRPLLAAPTVPRRKLAAGTPCCAGSSPPWLFPYADQPRCAGSPLPRPHLAGPTSTHPTPAPENASWREETLICILSRRIRKMGELFASSVGACFKYAKTL